MTNKEIILQTALQLFGEQGYDRTPTSQIGKQAGVSEGLIFRHYGNKAGLLAAIIQEGLAHIAATMQPYSEPAADPREAILQHIQRSLTAIREHEKFWRLATKVRFQSTVQEIAGAQIEAVNQFIVQHLADNFRRLGAEAPAQEALLLFALLDGVCIHWLQDPTDYPIDEMKNLLIKKYKHAYF
ncbi:MAG: TetR/AcrR family transcriptional regulator [Saprospiraceae bacterium]